MILYKLHLLNNPLGLVVLLGELLVSQELGVHSSGGNVLGTLLLLDAVGVSLVRVVVRTGVLLLLGSKEKSRGGNKEGEMIYSYTINILSSRCFAVGKNAFAKSRSAIAPSPKRQHSSRSCQRQESAARKGGVESVLMSRSHA